MRVDHLDDPAPVERVGTVRVADVSDDVARPAREDLVGNAVVGPHDRVVLVPAEVEGVPARTMDRVVVPVASVAQVATRVRIEQVVAELAV